MRRIAFVLISAVAAVVMTATAALADSPHFISATNSIDTSTGALVTSFKDAGLGTGTSSIAITLSATASATYQCYNKAGNKPQGVPKSFGPTALATPPIPFPVRHGQTTASLSLDPLGPAPQNVMGGPTMTNALNLPGGRPISCVGSCMEL